MKKLFIITGVVIILFSSCSTYVPVAKSIQYKGMYSEKPLTVLLMPPINRSTNVEAKEYFHATLNVPLDEQGFYVIPPLLTMEILKKESAYDAELFLNGPLTKFGEVFGADVALFTIIHTWNKSGLMAMVQVEVEYILKSVKTGEVLYTRRGLITYDASVNSGAGGLGGLIANVALSAINTAATKYVDVARICNLYTLRDMPVGKYSPLNNLDGGEMAGQPSFKATVKSTYH